MNLGEGWIRKERAPFVSAIGGRDIAAACVSREIKHISISAGREHDSIRCVSFNFSRIQASGHDSLGVSVDNHEVEHFRLGKHLHRAGRDLTAKRLITTEQKLLSGLSARVEGARYLRAAKGAVGQQSAIFAGKRHALRNALVDDVIGDLSEAIHVRFTGAKVAALDGVVKQSVNAVAVVLIIFRRVDPTLGCNRMRASRRILETKTFHSITKLAQRRRSRSAGQTASYNDDLEFSPVIWAN